MHYEMTWTLRLLDRCSGDLLDTDLETHRKNAFRALDLVETDCLSRPLILLRIPRGISLKCKQSAQ